MSVPLYEIKVTGSEFREFCDLEHLTPFRGFLKPRLGGGEGDRHGPEDQRPHDVQGATSGFGDLVGGLPGLSPQDHLTVVRGASYGDEEAALIRSIQRP